MSSTDIARELDADANSIYQLSRGGTFDLPATLLPPGATRISGEIRAFECLPVETTPLANVLEPIPGRILLKDGRVISDIHRVIICTGYHITLPFLRQYHSDSVPVHEANDTVLVTDGTQVHNLHKDIFYIPDPSLIFIGIPYFTATFTLFEFQAMAATAVLAGRAFLPKTEDMRWEYERRLREKGAGKMFHSLKDKEVEYVDALVRWMNEDGASVGAPVVEGHTEAWHEANRERIEKMRRIARDKASESVRGP